MKRFHSASLGILMLLTVVSLASADGFIVPVDRPSRPMPVRGSWAVKYHHVDVRVRDQVASVTIDQEFLNTTGGMLEVEYFFPVPPGAAIDSMALIVNGKEFKARLLEADEARKIYEDIVRRKKDPALLEYAGYGLYRTRAFPLEKDTPARVQVTYKQVCKKDGDTVEVWYPLNTEKFSAKKIEDVRVTVDIKGKSDIAAVYSPTHDLDVKRNAPRHVIATYHEKDILPTTDIQVFYQMATSADDAVGATLLTHQPDPEKDGYFLMLVSPNPRRDADSVAAKDVVVVFDHSSSMSGDKMRQARHAVNYVLKHLNAKDRFNVIAYCDSVRPLFDGLVEVNEANIQRAMEDVDRIDSTGGTAIYDALQTAVRQWAEVADADKDADKDRDRPKYIIFLTDGQPTIPAHNRPETIEEDVILRETAKANEIGARIFAFGVGYDVNIRLLDKLVADNHGRSDYVKPNEPIEKKVASLYNKIKNPVMTNLAVKLQGVRIYDTYPREIGDLFEGDQIVIAGRYDARDAAKLPTRETGVHAAQLVITGRYQGKTRGFEYPVALVANRDRLGFDFVEKIWAVRRVGFLMDQIQLNGRSEELVDELVRLSRTYGIMTPYTSFLADETTPLHSPVAVRERAKAEADRLERDVDGWAGQNAATARRELKAADVAIAKSAPTLAEPTRPGSDAPAAPADEGSVMYGNASQTAYEAGERQRVGGMRNVGNQAVYQRGKVWVAANAADVDLAKDAKNIQVIERFSEEYFKLVRANTKLENEVLASQRPAEELVIRLRGQVYQIR